MRCWWITLVIGLVSCSDHEQKEMKEQTVVPVVSQEQPKLNNPCLYHGGDYVSFLRQLFLQVNYSELINQLSQEDREAYSDDDLVMMINQLELSPIIQLKSFKKENANTYLMNYNSQIMATNKVRRFRVVVENDSCRLMLHESLYFY